MVPKDMLVDSFIYSEYAGKDRNHAPTFKEEEEIEFVRINRKRTYYRDSSDSGVKHEAKIFCYQAHTTPFLEFKEQSKVSFDNKDYTIVDVNEYNEPFSNNRTIYELGVI